MSGLKRMRIIATSALAAMVGLYILARSLEHHALFWSYVAAFAEAAMVGALADWFAVVALFRHPMGLRPRERLRGIAPVLARAPFTV